MMYGLVNNVINLLFHCVICLFFDDKSADHSVMDPEHNIAGLPHISKEHRTDFESCSVLCPLKNRNRH